MKRIKTIAAALLVLGTVLAAGGAEKRFFTTVDILDNYWKCFHTFSDKDAPAERPAGAGSYRLADLEAMVEAVRDLGFSRLYWITNFSDIYNHANAVLDDGEPLGGVELLRQVVAMCHRRGVEFFIILKPFETKESGTFPVTVSAPEEFKCVPRLGGAASVIDLLAEHPEMRLRRRLSRRPADDRVAEVTLVSTSSGPIELGRADLQLFAGPENGVYRELTDFSVEAIEVERDGFQRPALRLRIAEPEAGDRFFIVKCNKRNEKPQVVNSLRTLVELRNPAGELLPRSIGTGQISRAGLIETLQWARLNSHVGDTKVPEEWLPPAEYGTSLETTAFDYNNASSLFPIALDGKDGYVAFSSLEDEYLSSPHPAYPEVMKLWLDTIAKLSETGADGVDIRISDHASWTIDGDEYGFNEPVVTEFKKRYGVDVLTAPEFDRARWRALNGEYFTNFMRRSAKILHDRGMKLHVHISMQMLDRDFWTLNDAPVNFKWEWRKWIEEGLIDGISLKYLPFPFGAKAGSGWKYINMLTELARRHGLETSAEARLMWWVEPANHTSPPFTDAEYNQMLEKFTPMMESELDGLNFYEVSDYFVIDAYGRARKSAKFANLLNTLRNREKDKK